MPVLLSVMVLCSRHQLIDGTSSGGIIFVWVCLRPLVLAGCWGRCGGRGQGSAVAFGPMSTDCPATARVCGFYSLPTLPSTWTVQSDTWRWF